MIVPLAALFYYGCHKSNDSTANANTGYITASAWYLKAFRYDIGANGTDDYVYAPNACETDDKYAFSEDNELVFDPGVKLCDSTEAVVTTTWAFTGGGTKLSFGGSAYNIKTINDTLFTLYYDTTESGATYRAYIDFKH